MGSYNISCSDHLERALQKLSRKDSENPDGETTRETIIRVVNDYADGKLHY